MVKVVMKQNHRPDQGQLQTQQLAMNSQHVPKVAEETLQLSKFTHCDQERIGQPCEKAGPKEWASSTSSSSSSSGRR